DRDGAAERLDATSDSDQSEPGIGAARDAGDVEADAVVVDRAGYTAGLTLGANDHAVGTRVLQDVRDGLVHDAIQGRLDHRRQAPGAAGVDTDGQRRATRDAAGEGLQRGTEAEIVENRGPQFVREATELAGDLLEDDADFLKALAGGRRDAAAQTGQRELRHDHELPGLIVNLVGQAPGFRLQRVVHAAQRGF